MAKISHLMASGMPAKMALSVNGGNFSSGGLKATGTTKATALQLTDVDSYVSICSSGTGVNLIGGDQGDDFSVFNGGANALLVYTQQGSTDTITNSSANAGFTVSSMKGVWFNKVTGSLWMVNYSK